MFVEMESILKQNQTIINEAKCASEMFANHLEQYKFVIACKRAFMRACDSTNPNRCIIFFGTRPTASTKKQTNCTFQPNIILSNLLKQSQPIQSAWVFELLAFGERMNETRERKKK